MYVDPVEKPEVEVEEDLVQPVKEDAEEASPAKKTKEDKDGGPLIPNDPLKPRP